MTNMENKEQWWEAEFETFIEEISDGEGGYSYVFYATPEEARTLVSKVAKESYSKGYGDGFKQGRFDTEMDKEDSLSKEE
jgi:hypothetical protein